MRGHSSRTHGPRTLTMIVRFCSPRPRGRHPSHSSRSLSLAFLISRVLHSPPALLALTLLAPSLSHRETSVVTIFRDKGSDILSNAFGSGTRYRMRWRQAQAVLSFGVVLFWLSGFFLLVHLATSNSLA